MRLIRHGLALFGLEMLVRRATDYLVQVSLDGRHWRALATVRRQSGVLDRLDARARGVRLVRLLITGATRGRMPLLQELMVS